jgi:hypothetical protein
VAARGPGAGHLAGRLKKQAEATYRTGRGQRILDFASAMPAGWRARPNVHLAYRFASVPQRVYLTCDLGLGEHVHGWLGEDFAHVGGHHPGQVRPVLWPWLLERGYADVADESQLHGFLHRLGKRDAHLRPGIGLERAWSREDAAALDRRGILAGESAARSPKCCASSTSRYPLAARHGTRDDDPYRPGHPAASLLSGERRRGSAGIRQKRATARTARARRRSPPRRVDPGGSGHRMDQSAGRSDSGPHVIVGRAVSGNDLRRAGLRRPRRARHGLPEARSSSCAVD